jgi:hypothetical protein
LTVHPLLEQARDSASRYAVLRSERGWNLWRFADWNQPFSGWRIAVADLKSREDGWITVLNRLGLIREDPPIPLPPAPPRVILSDPERI